jgi:DHA2 family multidrug resistance protein
VVLATVLCGSVLSTLIANTTTLHKTGISQQLSVSNTEAAAEKSKARQYYLSQGLKPAEADKMADNPLQSDMKKSATLLAYKEIYGVMAVISFLPILLLAFAREGKHSLKSVEVIPLPV